MGNPQHDQRVLGRPIEPLLPAAADQRRQRLDAGHVLLANGGDALGAAAIYDLLDREDRRCAVTIVVHGCHMDVRDGTLRGGDEWIDLWARQRGVRVEPVPPEPHLWGPGANAMRWRQALERGVHGVVLLPGADPVLERLAQHAGVPIRRPIK